MTDITNIETLKSILKGLIEARDKISKGYNHSMGGGIGDLSFEIGRLGGNIQVLEDNDD